jgi:hypothetical protein
MKKIFRNGRLVAIAALIFFSAASCSRDEVQSNNSNNSNLQSQINSLPREPLNAAELSSLAFMREEEKLARDVYMALYAKWGVPVFNNISGSEQSHTDAVLLLLNKYNLPDPAANNPAGIFSNAGLQALYTQLVAEGSTGIAAAYRVGATIEDLDLYDLQQALLNTDNQDIRLVYGNLARGSRNHLRSFYTNILITGGTYTPQYISAAEFEAIVNSAMETGN